jgi:thiamine pyrophosphokinase
MKSKIAYLFTHPTPSSIYSNYYSIPTDAFIIGVDGGTNILEKLKLKPDLIIGDMDSIQPEILKKYEIDVPVIKYPIEKDETDCELAVKWCIENKFKEITIVNTLEGRFDHVMGLIQNLFYAKKHHIRAKIESRIHQIFLIEKEQIINAKAGTNISLIPLSPIVANVRAEGLEYHLNAENLFQHQSRGISNVFKDETTTIRYHEGELLAILTL